MKNAQHRVNDEGRAGRHTDCRLFAMQVRFAEHGWSLTRRHDGWLIASKPSGATRHLRSLSAVADLLVRLGVQQ